MKRDQSVKKGWALHQKRWFGKWHLYLGIIAGAILVIVGLTGSILVFQDEIDIALNKDLFIAQAGSKRIPIGEIAEIAKQRYPDKPFDYVMNSDEHNPNSAYRFFHYTGDVETEFFLNPYTGELSGKRLHESAFIHILTDIHRTLFIPVAGRYIVGFATLCMLILTISGLRLWIPQQYKKWKQWKSVLTVNFKAGFKRQNYDWHNVLGFYSAPVVIMLAITGFTITFSTVFIGALFMLNGQSPLSVASIFAKQSVKTENAISLTPVQADSIAHQLLPEARLLGMAIPTNDSMVYRLDLLSEGASKTGNRIMLMVDQYSGKVILNSETDFPNVGNSYLTWLTPLHYGTFGGWPTRILALLAGLMPLVLYITGFIIWWPRYKKRSTGNAPKPPKEDPAAVAIRALPFGKYYGYHFKKGLKYAGWLMLCSLLAGALYGLLSGIVVQPALFCLLYAGISICVNFVIAMLVFVVNVIFFAPFKRASKPVFKYHALSLACVLLFLPVIVAIAVYSKDIF